MFYPLRLFSIVFLSFYEVYPLIGTGQMAEDLCIQKTGGVKTSGAMAPSDFVRKGREISKYLELDINF